MKTIQYNVTIGHFFLSHCVFEKGKISLVHAIEK